MTLEPTQLPALTETLAAAHQFGDLKPSVVMPALTQVIPLTPPNQAFWPEFRDLVSEQISQRLIAHIRELMADLNDWQCSIAQELNYDDHGCVYQVPTGASLNGMRLPIDDEGDVDTDTEELELWFEHHPGFDMARMRHLNSLMHSLFWELRSGFNMTNTDFTRLDSL